MAGKLGIGVIGCGGMGTSLAKTCLKIPYIEVVATYDPIETQARILAIDRSRRTITRASVIP